MTLPELTDTRKVATNITEADYMERYAEHFNEWVAGSVFTLTPINLQHYDLNNYLADLLKIYFLLKPIGRIVEAPFVMKLGSTIRREPDLQIILNANLSKLKPTFMDGAADICIEITSPATVAVDRGEKFTEYEKAGVQEYWIIDPERQLAEFHRLNAAKLYQPQQPDAQGDYRSPLLPDFVLNVPLLWQKPLPDYFEIGKMVQKMLGLLQ